MIPITVGKSSDDTIAYFTDGRIKHTNEIMVHLGAGYYVQRTAHESNKIIDRRLDVIHKQDQLVKDELDKLHKMLGLINSSQNYNSKEKIIEPVSDSGQKQKGTARLTQDGILEIEEPYEEEVKPKQKKQSNLGIIYMPDPFSVAQSPADLTKISTKLQEENQIKPVTQTVTQVNAKPKPILKKPTSYPTEQILSNEALV